jgi:hypothetical protein
MTELVSGMPSPQFGNESSWVRELKLVKGSSGSCVSALWMLDVFTYLVKCLRVPAKMWEPPRLKTLWALMIPDITAQLLQQKIYLQFEPNQQSI